MKKEIVFSIDDEYADVLKQFSDHLGIDQSDFVYKMFMIGLSCFRSSSDIIMEMSFPALPLDDCIISLDRS